MKVQIIIGSTRPGRIGSQVAKWVMKNLPEQDETAYELVDLGDYKLPIFDEPIHPSMGQYKHDHTLEWSKKIKEADAYVFVTPEYNAGYPASLKNAIDYLFHEWKAKPVMIVSYGVNGGQGASAQLRQVAERLKMQPTNTSPMLTITREMSGEDGQLKDTAESLKSYEAILEEAGDELLTIGNAVEVLAA
ncbi:MAG: NAD(FAD)-dependent dehydrogenase [Candidatus Saccharibacteria bacterium]|nr:NAD(FAD)-dependent dehydrogenase [Candidatus Saccharibacteria bacterium]